MIRTFILEVQIDDNTGSEYVDRPIEFIVLYDNDIFADVVDKKETNINTYTSQEEYEEAYDFLRALFEAGVENWEGFKDAKQIANTAYGVDWC